MKKLRQVLTTLALITFVFIIAGCSSQSASSTEHNYSKNELLDFYAQIVSQDANVTNAYIKSYNTGKNYVEEPANKQIKLINSIDKRLEKNSSNKTATNDLLNYSKNLKSYTKMYKKNSFNKKTAINLSNSATKLDKSLHTHTTKNKNVVSAIVKGNKAHDKLIKFISSQPHIDGKKVTNSNGEIEFKNSSIVPGDNGKSVLEIYYDYKNTTNKPQSAFSALLASGDFTQEDGDTIANNLFPSAITDAHWAVNHKEESDLGTSASAESLKSGSTKEYIAFVELKNTNNPLVFKAVDQQSRTSLGNIKIPLNN